ncbi:hypothetical protein Agub_g9610 [Astrephomene gubernaculifera]|uniref:WD40 repeat-like protein n=1 Tax=Astrephomene gubernaculifera TaxID=47775 RepID=A0AAD3DW93_9CHLO|nr:hypothetical protein Agub_g9610 [Astrephomene gubernaculifera]
MPQSNHIDRMQASRLRSNAEASSSSANEKTRRRTTQEQATQRWLASRAPLRQGQDHHQPQTPEALTLATLKHRLHQGHNYPVTSVAFNPKGDILATASKDIRLYDVTSGRLRVILDGHGGLVRCLSFTPDGRLLCSGSDDCTALVWSLENCLAMCVPGSVPVLTPPGGPSSSNLPTNTEHPSQSLLKAHSASSRSLNGGTPSSVIAALAAVGDGALSLANSLIFDPMSRVVQRVLQRHHKPILSLATTPDSKYLVTGSADKTVRVWDVCTGYCMLTLRGHSGEVTCVALTPNGRRILSGGTDHHVVVWDFATGESRRVLKGHRGPVNCIAVAPDGQWVVTGGFDKQLRFWDLVNGNELAALPAHGGAYGVLSAAVSPDGSTIMSGGYDNLAKLWDAKSGLPLATLTGHRHMVSCVAFSRDCTAIATAARDDEVRLYIWVPGYRPKQPLRPEQRVLRWASISASQSRALLGGGPGGAGGGGERRGAGGEDDDESWRRPVRGDGGQRDLAARIL